MKNSNPIQQLWDFKTWLSQRPREYGLYDEMMIRLFLSNNLDKRYLKQFKEWNKDHGNKTKNRPT